jgi:DNA-binding NarL/FixJ family response regulator
MKILIVDDHEIVREGVRTLLAKSRPEWDICGEASNGRDAIAAARDLQPDLIIMDISMPGLSGLEVLPRLRQMGINSLALMFTMHESSRLGLEARQAGAQGYVLKSQAALDLVRAIDTLIAGGTFYGTPGAIKAPGQEPNPGATLCIGLAFAF